MESVQKEVGLSQDIIAVLFPGDPKQDVIAGLEAKFPGIKVYWRNIVTGSGTFPQDIWAKATILWTFEIPETTNLPKLRFVQMQSAGADHWSETPQYKDPKVSFCTANGAHP